MVAFGAVGSSMCRLLPQRKGVARMDFFDLLDHVSNIGTFIIALLTFFREKK